MLHAACLALLLSLVGGSGRAVINQEGASADLIQAAASSSRADETTAPSASDSAASSGVDTGQISTPASGDASADQISAPSRSQATDSSQLTRSTPRADAPAALSTPTQGRDTATVAIRGHDRCDPAAGASARQADCARIVDSRADEFTGPTPDPTAPVVHSDASSSGLVNDVLNGGTGGVVVLPGK